MNKEVQSEIKELEEMAETLPETEFIASSEVVDESELDDYDFMENLEEVNTDLEIPIQIVKFANPKKPDKPFLFAMRQLTAAEYGEIFQAIVDTDMLEEVLSESLQNGKPPQKAGVEELVKKGINEEMVERQQDRQVAAIFKCMLRPKKKTIKSIKALPTDMRNSLFSKCSEAVSRSWIFQNK